MMNKTMRKQVEEQLAQQKEYVEQLKHSLANLSPLPKYEQINLIALHKLLEISNNDLSRLLGKA